VTGSDGSISSFRNRSGIALALAAVAVLVVPAAARADDRAVIGIATALLPRAATASSDAAGGTVGVQRQYDAARDIQEALAAATPASPACAPLAEGLGDYARAQVAQAEGVDRLRPAQVARAGSAGTTALARIRRVKAACVAHPAPALPAAVTARVDDPASFEAFFGTVRARAPRAATTATVSFGGRIVARAAVEDGWLRTRISAPPARGSLVVTFLSAAGTPVGRATSRAVWLLPRSAAVAVPGVTHDRGASAELARIASTFAGIAGIYAVDLVTGEQAAWNETARFPAASSVKLAVLTAALKRFGPRPEEQPSFPDLQALTAWSSNLAANRLLAKLGGPAVVQAELRRLGARSSTYPGSYVVGTAFTREPPVASSRFTTARDLGDTLATLHRVALGQARARASSGLTIHEARVALALLLSSQPAGDNIGMIRTALGPGMPIAQKQGWLDDVRITAALVYAPRGPRIVVICAYALDLSLGAAAAFGRRVVDTLGLR
jgi:beta-lactamase class A